MTTPSFAVIAITLFLFLAAVFPPLPSVYALGGSANTVAVVYGANTTICSLASDRSLQQIQCWRDGQLVSPVFPTVSFDVIAGGRDLFCAVRSGGFSILCFDSNFSPRRIYTHDSVPVTSLAIGDAQICALLNVTVGSNGFCWRGDNISSPQISVRNPRFRAISSGLEISCGILENNNQVLCWGDDVISPWLQLQFQNSSMDTIEVGGRHACGIDVTGLVICRGDNSSGQLNVPSNSPYEYRALALGANHSCAIRRLNHTVVCWGGNGEFSSNVTTGISFESIVAGLNFTCGLTTSSFSVMCWGLGWSDQDPTILPLQPTVPGPCVDTSCPCNLYPNSEALCSGNGHICRPCDIPVSVPPISPPSLPFPPGVSPSPASHTRWLRRGLLAFAIVGSIGAFAGICTIIYCLWTGVCLGNKRIHNSVQPTITANNVASQHQSSSNPSSRSSTLRRQASILMRRQRSGTSTKHPEKAEEFVLSDLAAATNNFSSENRIGAGSFGVIYKGKLPDGREVAIKRSETILKKKFQEKESAFESELTFLSRLHHKHLVRLVGYCVDKEERLLVYEYMKNGALYDHLHDKNNVQKSSSLINSWKIRIKISLDAARGIEYLHNYAVPPIIHRDIKSSNILLDSNWIARVSDFGLSLMGPDSSTDFRPMKAAGTIGYIDPEYYGLNVLTAKSDVYGLGVVLLELLTGKRAIFKTDSEGEPISVVDFAVPMIMTGELGKILDPRVGPPEGRGEAEAVELVAYTAMHCVHLEGKDRPTMTDIVANLERALASCEDSHGSISSGRISIVSE